ncbi:MAG: aldo/keto reductase [Candidatus Melainabacteria bacterium]|nr:aldo/keto reductase [Candidatus Melainabacteria bacterium]
MNTRKLGNQGLTTSAIGLGCMGMSFAYGSADESEAIKVIHRALELGVNFLDTAERYGPYKNEELIGRAIKGKRDQAVIATKFGFKYDEAGNSVGLDSHPKTVKAVAEASMKRLGIDVIDLYYQHRVDPNVPIEETVGAMAELVKEGKVRYLGLSEAGEQTIRRAHKVHPISALQSEYSIWERNLEPVIMPVLRELKIGLVAYCPIGRGILTGEIKSFDDLPEGDYRRHDPRYQGENFKRNLLLVDEVNEVADRYGATPAQVAIAWLLHQGIDIVPIPGTKHVRYLEENTVSFRLDLEDEDLAALSGLATKTAGERYEQPLLAQIDR